ncbi:TauD/TfdA family dioxygenase [Vibrio sp. ZSDE26]|uniref:TauD/TfdA family dioxygenase n=1 Tax=Vibrio amylolyticus TaxID=2847292 RepID=A0A9X1XIP9_9VIBR|nr:TauD/TfdA family dioxygenase [Vibrio amylolyticus]MCK6263967.1 TauD/TfdA family dioxygenase [Vibrio amylolyticus]
MIHRISLDELCAKTVSDFGVVCIDLDVPLSPVEFVQASKKLGSVVPFELSRYRPNEYPKEVTLIDNLGDGLTAAPPCFGEGWHQDSSFLPNAPEYTLLHALDVPSDGGETHFSDTRQGWSRLPEPLREVLRGYELTHAVRDSYRLVPKDVGRSLGELLHSLPHSSHRLVQNHPRVGETLFLSPLYTSRNLTEDQQVGYSTVYKEVLKDQVTHYWQPSQILAWDNRVVLHCASGYAGTQRRRLIRTMVQDIGEE